MSENDLASDLTEAVRVAIFSDGGSHEYWLGRATKAQAYAETAESVTVHGVTRRNATVWHLAYEMSQTYESEWNPLLSLRVRQVLRKSGSAPDGVYHAYTNLLATALGAVNWNYIAEEFARQLDPIMPLRRPVDVDSLYEAIRPRLLLLDLTVADPGEYIKSLLRGFTSDLDFERVDVRDFCRGVVQLCGTYLVGGGLDRRDSMYMALLIYYAPPEGGGIEMEGE